MGGGPGPGPGSVPSKGHTINQSIDPKGNKNPTHPKYQNDNIDDNQMKMSKFNLTES